MQTQTISNSNKPTPDLTPASPPALSPAQAATTTAPKKSPPTQHRPTLAARIVRGLFLTASRPGVPNLAVLAKAVSGYLARRKLGRVGSAATDVPAVVVLTGPSGGGKSMLLRAIERELLTPRRAKHAGHAGQTSPGSTSSPNSGTKFGAHSGDVSAASAQSVVGVQTEPLIVRADMLRHTISAQGAPCRVVLRDKATPLATVSAATSRGALPAMPVLTCDPPVDVAIAPTGDSRATPPITCAQPQHHTRILPADVQAVHRWLACLASAGLADAGVLLLPLHKLSTGQRARHTLAVAMHRCTLSPPLAAHGRDGATKHAYPPHQPLALHRRVLLVDELGSALDAITAFSVAISLRRWAIANNISLVVATADPRIVASLKPQLEVDLPLHNGLAEPRKFSHVRAKP